MMAALWIACAILLLLAIGSSWLLVLITKNNEKITAERDAARTELWNETIARAQDRLEIEAKNDIIMDMQRSIMMLERQHNVALEGLHRIIGQLLLKQEGIVQNIAGGGGSADPEDKHEETPLRLVQDG